MKHISLFVSLTLTPMLCSRFLRVTEKGHEHGPIYRRIEAFFVALEAFGSDHAKEEIRELRGELFARGEPAARVLIDGLHILETADQRPLLSQLRVPSLWLAGRRDRLVDPRAMREAAALDAMLAAHGFAAIGTCPLFRLIESAAREDGLIEPFEGDTAIFITPGYRFKAIDGLMTNFHLPRSTLFMLVSALMGLDVMQSAYAHAIGEGYRFYSYGDASLLLPKR